MSIISSNKVRLVIATQDTTDFNFSTNEATELGLTGDITLSKEGTSITYGVGKLETRLSKTKNIGYTGTTLSFSTYIKPSLDASTVSMPEKLLWESLTSNTLVETVLKSTVAFSNSTKLRDLFFYFLLEDGSYYKVSAGVVAGVTIDLDISSISKATWSVEATNLEYISTNTTSSGTGIKLLSDVDYLRNKLTTISLALSSVNYLMAIISGTVTISNTVVPINRTELGVLQVPKGFYVADRSISIAVEAYLNTAASGTRDLNSVLNSYSTIASANSKANVILSLGGITSTSRVDIKAPSCTISKAGGLVGRTNTVQINLYPEESVVGALDDLTVEYLK